MLLNGAVFQPFKLFGEDGKTHLRLIEVCKLVMQQCQMEITTDLKHIKRIILVFCFCFLFLSYNFSLKFLGSQYCMNIDSWTQKRFIQILELCSKQWIWNFSFFLLCLSQKVFIPLFLMNVSFNKKTDLFFRCHCWVCPWNEGTQTRGIQGWFAG